MGNAVASSKKSIEILQNLRQQTGLTPLSAKEFWQSPCGAPAIAKGSLVELLGNARTEWLLQLFQQHPEPYIFWCEREPLLNPVALHQRGISLQRIQFMTSREDFQQPLRLVLESGQYPFIVAPTPCDEVRVFQRFQLFAEKSQSVLFFLGDKNFSHAWPISLQMNIDFADSGFEIQVSRQKHGLFL